MIICVSNEAVVLRPREDYNAAECKGSRNFIHETTLELTQFIILINIFM